MTNTTSIVQQLAEWLSTRRFALDSSGVVVTEFFPDAESSAPWKASIGLIKDDILANYSVWERTLLQTELIVVDGKTGDALKTDEIIVEYPEDINVVLDNLVDDLISGYFLRS